MQLNKKAITLITVGMIIIGFFSIILVKAYYQGKNTSGQEESLPSLLQLEIENEKLVKENENLTKQLSSLQEGESAAVSASQQLEQANINAGFVALSGPGIRITLDDSDKYREASFAKYVIHEEYIRIIINALWNGGAEAIAVNDQRVTSHTEIFCNGSYIQINGTRQMPPYHIVAIGNQNNLKSALQFYFWDMLGEYQQQYGITRKLETPDEPLTVPAAKEFKYKYTEPLKGE